MKDIADLISEHPFFAGLDQEHIALIAGCGVNQVYEPEEFLFRTGNEANTFFIVRAGRVAIEVTSSTGVIRVETFGAGAVIGWSWLIPPHQWRFDGRALQQTRVVALDGTCLRNKCEAMPELGYQLLRRFSSVLVERLEATRLQLLDLYGSTA